MPKYRVLTPKGASFTVAGSDYSYEREALDPIELLLLLAARPCDVDQEVDGVEAR